MLVWTRIIGKLQVRKVMGVSEGVGDDAGLPAESGSVHTVAWSSVPQRRRHDHRSTSASTSPTTPPPRARQSRPNTAACPRNTSASRHILIFHPRAIMADTEENPLLSTTRASDTSPQVQLHPLVLLTVSDYITRHTLRQQSGPIVGAIIGQQNGREITMEVAFEAKLIAGDDGEVRIDDQWFGERLEQCKSKRAATPYCSALPRPC